MSPARRGHWVLFVLVCFIVCATSYKFKLNEAFLLSAPSLFPSPLFLLSLPLLLLLSLPPLLLLSLPFFPPFSLSPFSSPLFLLALPFSLSLLLPLQLEMMQDLQEKGYVFCDIQPFNPWQ